MSLWIVTIILIVTLYLLISEKIPVDVTAIGIMVVLMLGRILSPLQAVLGFANPAVITVGAMLLVSQGMIRTGAVGFIGQKVIELLPGKSEVRHDDHPVDRGVCIRFYQQHAGRGSFYPHHFEPQLRIQPQPVEIPDSGLICIHTGRHLHPDRNLDQYYRQRLKRPVRLWQNRHFRTLPGRHPHRHRRNSVSFFHAPRC